MYIQSAGLQRIRVSPYNEFVEISNLVTQLFESLILEAEGKIRIQNIREDKFSHKGFEELRSSKLPQFTSMLEGNQKIQ